jgi:hypothetical protein
MYYSVPLGDVRVLHSYVYFIFVAERIKCRHLLRKQQETAFLSLGKCGEKSADML